MAHQNFVGSEIKFYNLLGPRPMGDEARPARVRPDGSRLQLASPFTKAVQTDDIVEGWREQAAQEIAIESVPLVGARLKARELRQQRRIVRCLTLSVHGERLYVVQARDTGEDFVYSRSAGYLGESARQPSAEELRLPLAAPRQKTLTSRSTAP